MGSKILQFSKYIILSALIIALARPRTYTIFSDRDETKGIDIFLELTFRPVCWAKDLEPDRITALKKNCNGFCQKGRR